jgi:hypothetical protein
MKRTQFQLFDSLHCHQNIPLPPEHSLEFNHIQFTVARFKCLKSIYFFHLAFCIAINFILSLNSVFKQIKLNRKSSVLVLICQDKVVVTGITVVFCLCYSLCYHFKTQEVDTITRRACLWNRNIGNVLDRML